MPIAILLVKAFILKLPSLEERKRYKKLFNYLDDDIFSIIFIFEGFS